MALVVEDGTGLVNADTMISLAFFKAYADARGWDYSSYADTTKIEPAIRRGSEHISNAFVFNGAKTLYVQAFAWPRYGLVDPDGFAIPSNSVPVQVQKATAEATWRELVSAGSLNPDVTPSERVKSEQVGPLSVTYMDGSRSTAASRPDVKIIRDLLRGLLAGGDGGTIEMVRG